MNRLIDRIPKILNKANIEKAIFSYHDLLDTIPLEKKHENIIDMMLSFKRRKIDSGPYPNVTLFESANRIMTDLTILYGVRDLLNSAIPKLYFDEYHVEFGNDNYNKNDINANNGQVELIGEDFNVAPSFFQTKKSSALKKMRKQSNGKQALLLLYNSDAVSLNYSPRKRVNEYYLSVQVNSYGK